MKREIEEEVVWRTIEVVRIDETNYAYQQLVVLKRFWDKKKETPAITEGMGLGYGESAATVPTEEHRLVPISETLDEKEMEHLLSEFDEKV